MTLSQSAAQAHAAAVQRCVAAMSLDDDDLTHLTLRDLPAGTEKTALMRCRFEMGLSMCPNSRVLVSEHAFLS